MAFYNENSIRLRSRNFIQGRPILLSFNTNRFNRVGLSCRVNDQYINADLTIDEFHNMVHCVEQAINSKEANEVEVELSKNNQQSGSIKVGRDNDGFVYITIGENGKGEQQFFFLPKRQFVWKRNGQPMTEVEICRMRAIRWCKYFPDFINKSWVADYKDEQAGPGGRQGGGNNYGSGGGNRSNNNGGGNRNYNNNGGGNRQYSQPPLDADGDLDSYLPN